MTTVDELKDALEGKADEYHTHDERYTQFSEYCDLKDEVERLKRLIEDHLALTT